MYDLIDECFFDDMIDVNNYRDAQDFIYKLYGNAEEEHYVEYKKILQEHVSEFLESRKVGKGTLAEEYKKPVPVSVFMVLSNPKFKRKMLRKAKNKCFKKRLMVRDH